MQKLCLILHPYNRLLCSNATNKRLLICSYPRTSTKSTETEKAKKDDTSLLEDKSRINYGVVNEYGIHDFAIEADVGFKFEIYPMPPVIFRE
jgi:hypothetical protein